MPEPPPADTRLDRLEERLAKLERDLAAVATRVDEQPRPPRAPAPEDAPRRPAPAPQDEPRRPDT